MKILLPVLTLLFSSIFSSAQNAAVDEKFGFKDIKLESSLPDLLARVSHVKVFEDSVLASYDLTDPDYLKAGNCSFAEVNVTSYRGKIYNIRITTSSPDESHCVLRVLQALYAKPGTQSNEYIPTYVWTGSRAATIYDENQVTGVATTTLYGLQIQTQVLAYINSQDKSSAKDF